MLHILILAAALAATSTIDWRDPHSVARAAIEVSPATAAAERRIAAAQERVTLAASLPNPMVMTGVRDQNADLSVDRMMTMYMVGASQTLPRRSRRDAMRSSAEAGVRRLQSAAASQKADVEREALLAWYDAAAASSEAAATDEVKALTRQSTEAARARYETGGAPQADIIRSVLEEKMLDHQRLALDSRRRQAVTRLAALLHIDAASVPQFTLQHHAVHSQDVDLSLPADNAALTALQAEIDEAEQQIRLATLAAKPDINIEASWGFRPYEKDMVSVVGRMEIPFRRKTLIEPQVREAMARRDAAREELALLQQRLRQDIGVAAASRQEALAQIDLHERELVPAALLAFQSALSSYQTGKDSLESVLSALRSYVALNIDQFEFQAQARRAEVEINALRAGALPRERQ